MRVLLIEDDGEAAADIDVKLSEAGHSVTRAKDGKAGRKIAIVDPFEVLIVDRMLPGLDGLALVRDLRTAGISTPVILLTSLGGIEDRVDGLDAGADDYLVKPFAMIELLARVNALGRRAFRQDDTVLKIADLEVNLVTRLVRRGGQDIDLQPREFKLLEVLLRNGGRVLTRSMLLERVWDFHFDPKTSIVETHISRLRAKIDRQFDIPLVQTIRGKGYCINAPSPHP